MSDDDWPKHWPVENIHTNPPGPPYFGGHFKLHVYPTEFKIVRDSLPFFFWIKNPTKDTVDFEVFTNGAVSVVGSSRGTLKPMEISEPIGLDIDERDWTSSWKPEDDVYIGHGTWQDGPGSWRQLIQEASFHPRFFFDPPRKRFEKKKFEEFEPIKIGKMKKCAIM